MSAEADDISDRVLGAFPILEQLSPRSRALFDDYTRIIEPSAGTEIISRGDRVGGVYVVLSGELGVYVVSPEGKEAGIYTVRSGESCLFALNAVFSNVVYPAWVRVQSPGTAVLFVEGRAFRQLFETERPVREWVLQVQSQRVFDLISAIEEVQTLPLEQRLRSYLVRAADDTGDVYRTHDAIARHLGTSREVISRLLERLAADGLVQLARAQITLKGSL